MDEFLARPCRVRRPKLTVDGNAPRCMTGIADSWLVRRILPQRKWLLSGNTRVPDFKLVSMPMSGDSASERRSKTTREKVDKLQL
jgi:hypothetical protein